MLSVAGQKAQNQLHRWLWHLLLMSPAQQGHCCTKASHVLVLRSEYEMLSKLSDTELKAMWVYFSGLTDGESSAEE